jgi:hypothetical protein
MPITILKPPEASGNVNETMNRNGNRASSSSMLNLNSNNNNNNTNYSHSHATTVKLHTHASSSTFVGVAGGFPSRTKPDTGPSAPRAPRYLYSSSKDTQDIVEDDEYEEREEGRENFAEDGSARYFNVAAEGGGGDEWYIGKYGKRRRQPYFHHRTQSADSAPKTTATISRYIPSEVERSTANLGSGVDPGEDSSCDRFEGDEPATDQTCNSEEGDDDDEENNKGVVDGTLDERTKEGSLKKKKKKKAKKRKIPVTVPVPLAATPSLSHSHSVPNLRSEDGRVDSSLNDSTAEDAIGVRDRSSRMASGRVGALVPSMSFLEVSKGSSSKKKGKQSSTADSFVLRGDPVYASSWQASKNGFAGWQSKRARLVALARHLQILFPEEQEILRKVVEKLDPSLKGDKKPKKKKGGKPYLDDCSLEYSSLADSDLQRALPEEEDPDPRGDAPGKKDTLVHVFIDQ